MATLREHLDAMTPQLEVLMELAREHPALVALAEISGRQAAALAILDAASPVFVGSDIKRIPDPAALTRDAP